MSVQTLLLYLIGSRKAIETIASSRSAVGLGLLFVLSAGFAREYDGADLLHEPWRVFIPFLASLVTSVILYSLLWATARVKEPAGLSFPEGFPSFLGLFWLTAPLAWLYAVPFERFLGPVEAMEANLACLGVV